MILTFGAGKPKYYESAILYKFHINMSVLSWEVRVPGKFYFCPLERAMHGPASATGVLLLTVNGLQLWTNSERMKKKERKDS